MDDTYGEINPCCEFITNKAEKDITIKSQMEQWSTLSTIYKYIQYNGHLKNIYDLHIRAVDQKNYKKIYNKEEERQILELDFGDTPEKLKGEY